MHEAQETKLRVQDGNKIRRAFYNHLETRQGANRCDATWIWTHLGIPMTEVPWLQNLPAPQAQIQSLLPRTKSPLQHSLLHTIETRNTTGEQGLLAWSSLTGLGSMTPLELCAKVVSHPIFITSWGSPSASGPPPPQLSASSSCYTDSKASMLSHPHTCPSL